jgi:hypothetical protein
MLLERDGQQTGKARLQPGDEGTVEERPFRAAYSQEGMRALAP